MPSLLIKTKTNIPALKRDLVLRKRINEALSEGIRAGRKLTLISAPAGFGKTTLVCEWLEMCKIPAAWVSLDENDGDAARFLTYLVTALQTLISGVGDGVLAAFQSSQPITPNELLTTLLNELSSIEDDFILVLDDLHAVDSRAVDELLAFLVEHTPQQMHLIITTREDPALPLARLRAKNQLTEIRTAELRFTENEAADFLNQVMGLDLSSQDIAVLEARTEGWVAGLQLAALSMQGKADATEFIHSFSGANQFVLDYLLEEVLQKQSESLQGFLLRTSILDRLSGSLCDALWQGKKNSAQEILEQLERANLFVISLDDERRWYRYHHLFRDLLRQRLNQKLGKEEVAGIHIRASEWFEQNGDIGEAFRHAITAEDFERAARLTESAWLGMDETFQTGTWLGWVNQLPLSVRRVRPVLLTQMGWSHMDAGNAEASESSLKDAEACLKNPLEDLVIVEAEQFRTLPARIIFARAYNAQTQNRFDDVVRYVETTLDMIPHEDQYMQAQASSILSTTYWASGELDKTYVFMSNWVDAAQQADNFAFAVAASFAKADILIAQGRLRDAIQVYQTALKLATTHGVESITAHHHLGLGLLYHEMGEDERAASHLQKSFELGRQTPIVDWAYRKSLAQAYLKEFEGDYDAALEALDEAQRFYVRTPIPNLRPVGAMKARIYLKQGQLMNAQTWARKSGLTLRDAPDYLHEFERVTLARIALAKVNVNFSDVVSSLERHLKLAETQNRLASQIEILIVLSLAFHAKGEQANAIDLLEQALKLAKFEGYLRLFVDEGELMRLLILDLRSALESSARTEVQPLFGYVEKLLAGFSQPTQLQKSKTEMIDPLSDREFEVLRLIAQGLSNQEITQKLFVALSTIKGHNLRIFAKLQAKSRTEAVARARELGLL
ncbi:MAG: LuxR C-terminal-related transcriptional regulator [Anaerolineales bacterium]|nr:LuxR C-terminal-related transcriptional regulator [Anaerolineales bacterium]